MKPNQKGGYLIDTNVFVEIFNQESEMGDYSHVVDFFADLPIEKRFTCDMNVLELYNRARSRGNREIEKIDLFLKEEEIKLFPITVADSKMALKLMKRYAIKGLKDKDALVAAIALHRNCHLVTIDKHFGNLKKEGLKIIKLAGYERGIINV